jgi:hypothetical protein
MNEDMVEYTVDVRLIESPHYGSGLSNSVDNMCR